MKRTSMFGRIFAHWAQDADPDEVAAAVDAMVEEEPEEEQLDADPNELEQAADPAAELQQKDSEGEVLMLLRQILAKLGGNATDADPMQQLVDELQGGEPTVDPNTEQIPDAFENEESVTVPAEEMGDDSKELTGENPIPGADSAGTLAALKAMQPYMAKLPEKDRRAANDAVTRAVRKALGRPETPTVDGYAALLQAQRKAAKRRTGDAKKIDESDLGARIMAKHNPHYKK